MPGPPPHAGQGNLIYDDRINRQIPVVQYELQIDSFTAIAG